MKNTSLFLALFFSIFSALPISAQKLDVFQVVENMPQFPGCEKMKASEEVIRKCAHEKLINFVYSNIKYPSKAKAQKLEATVIVQFVVDKSGDIRDVEIIEDLDGQFSATLKVMMAKMPKWIPGTQRGNKVNVQMRLPVQFKLDMEKPKPVPEKEPVKIYKNDGHSKISPRDKNGDVPPPPPPPGTIIAPPHKNDPNSEVPSPPTPPRGGTIVAPPHKADPNKEVPPPPPPPRPEEEVFKVVEEMPRFPGCEEGATLKELKDCSNNLLLQNMYKSIKYPAVARKNGVEGTAIVSFIVEKDGSLSKIVCNRDPGAGCGEEAVRVFQEMTDSGIRWIPGKQRGRAVRVQWTMPVRFKLEK